MEAKEVIITRPGAWEIITFKRETIFLSVGVVPGTSALVESLNNKSTPFFPTSASLTRSVFSPISVQSNLKSPVKTIREREVSTINPKEPGIE